MVIKGLKPPKLKKTVPVPNYKKATAVDLKPTTVSVKEGQLVFTIDLSLPLNWKINTQAPMAYHIAGEKKPILFDAKSVSKWTSVEKPSNKIEIKLPVKLKEGKETVKIYLDYYYCQDSKSGVCKTGSVVWNVPLQLKPSASDSKISLFYKVKK